MNYWPSRTQLELTWAAVCPPLVAALTVLFTGLFLRDISDEDSRERAAFLIPLVSGSMAVLAATIYFDCRATALYLRGASVRTTQGISTAVTLIVLFVAMTVDADRNRVYDAFALILFLCLPVLFVSAAFLWWAATMIQSAFRRALMLGGFVAATVLLELQTSNEVHRSADEYFFMMNSLLVAGAFAVPLTVWSAREFGRH